MIETEIKNMLRQLENVDEDVVSRYRNRDGYNYSNVHSPMDVDEVIKKVELFIEYGGKITQFTDHIQVKWQAHSEGELFVYRIGANSYFAHGWIEVG